MESSKIELSLSTVENLCAVVVGVLGIIKIIISLLTFRPAENDIENSNSNDDCLQDFNINVSVLCECRGVFCLYFISLYMRIIVLGLGVGKHRIYANLNSCNLSSSARTA